MSLAANEYARRAYLEALGIDSYMPRHALARAPQPALCHWVAPAQGESGQGATAQVGATAEPEAPTRQTRSPQVVDELLREMGDATPAARAQTAPAQPESASAGAEASETVEPFTLSVWRQPPLLVVDSRDPELPAPTEQLLHNLLRALRGQSDSLPREDILRWPLVDDPQAPRSEEDARSQMHAWLEAELAHGGIRQLLVMGETAARYLLPAGTDGHAALWQTLEVGEPALQARVAPSLTEILQQPLLKRRLWQMLQPLRQS